MIKLFTSLGLAPNSVLPEMQGKGVGRTRNNFAMSRMIYLS
ncbi:putative N-acetyltransferase YhbS [Sporomusaceae bacterium BoRhaA]|nr:putative N-acetyltransferase YhbS [Pelorhabdus rhamnosifermentans]